MPAGGTKPNRRAVADWALEQLYDLIFTGTLQPGDALAEEDVTARLGVSRSPAREALRHLETQGLLSVNPVNGRRFISVFGEDDVFELYTVRAGLEELGARYAAPRADGELIARLVQLQHDMEFVAVAREDPTRRDFEVDFDLHRAICRASGLRRLETSLEPIWMQTHALLRALYTRGIYGDAQEDAAAYRDHRRIIEALMARDADASAAAVRMHLEGRRDQLIAGLRAHSSAS